MISEQPTQHAVRRSASPGRLSASRPTWPSFQVEDREAKQCSVRIQFQYQLQREQGLLQNRSKNGVSLVTEFPMEPDQIATLEIEDVDGSVTKVRGVCVWTERLYDNSWLSGWRLLRRVFQ